MNAFTKNLIRIWITIFSFFAFAIGWITLSHSDTPAATVQPVAITQPATITTTGSEVGFAPIPSLEELTQNSRASANAPGFTVTTSRASTNISAAPRLRTMGS